MRVELEKAGVADTYPAQLALQLGRKLVDPSEKAATVTSLSKEIDRVMARALEAAKPGAGPGSSESEADEVSKAREARERKARDAASGA